MMTMGVYSKLFGVRWAGDFRAAEQALDEAQRLVQRRDVVVAGGLRVRQHGLEFFDEPAGAQEAPKSGATRVRAEFGVSEAHGDGLGSIVEHHGGVHLRVKSLVTWLWV